jgi:hypothetical protein
MQNTGPSPVVEILAILSVMCKLLFIGLLSLFFTYSACTMITCWRKPAFIQGGEHSMDIRNPVYRAVITMGFRLELQQASKPVSRKSIRPVCVSPGNRPERVL